MKSLPQDETPDQPERVGHPSLEGIHGTVPVPHHSEGFFRQWRVRRS